MPFCKTGYTSLSPLLFMVRKSNWIPNMFSSNSDDLDGKGKSYDDFVCTPKCPYATGNSGPASLLYAKT